MTHSRFTCDLHRAVSDTAKTLAREIHSIEWAPGGEGLRFQLRDRAYITREPYPEVVFPGDISAPRWCAAELIREGLKPEGETNQ